MTRSYDETIANTVIEPRLGYVFIKGLLYKGAPVEAILVDRENDEILFRIEGRWQQQEASAGYREEELS